MQVSYLPPPIGEVRHLVTKDAQFGSKRYKGRVLLTEIGGTSVDVDVEESGIRVYWGKEPKLYDDYILLVQDCYDKTKAGLFGNRPPLFLHAIAPGLMEMLGRKLPSQDIPIRMVSAGNMNAGKGFHTVADIIPCTKGKGKLGTICVLTYGAYLNEHAELASAVINNISEMYDPADAGSLYPKHFTDILDKKQIDIVEAQNLTKGVFAELKDLETLVGRNLSSTNKA
jgi:hypothetical protein